MFGKDFIKESVKNPNKSTTIIKSKPVDKSNPEENGRKIKAIERRISKMDKKKKDDNRNQEMVNKRKNNGY